MTKTDRCNDYHICIFLTLVIFYGIGKTHEQTSHVVVSANHRPWNSKVRSSMPYSAVLRTRNAWDSLYLASN